jgi:predicted aspartyl protease
MRKKNPSFRRVSWILGFVLALPTFSVEAGEAVSFFQYPAIFNRSGSSGAPERTLQVQHAEEISSQHANSWPVVISNVVSALPASGSTEAEIDTNSRKCLTNGSWPITSEAMPHSHSLSDTGASPIHFELADSLIYMQASINGSHPLWMMLDTGSSVTVFDETVSKMLGIQFLERGNVYGPGQGSAQKLAFADHATLMFAGEELGDQTVATLPLEWFSREVGRSTDGFLGSNVFRNYVVEIDYANQVLRFHDPAAYSYSGSGQRLPLQFIWNGIPTVQAEVVMQDGTAVIGTFMVDSGATTALWLTKDFSQAHPEFLSAQETIELPSVVAVGGEVSARLGHVSAVRLGGFVVAMPLTQFSQNTSGIFASPYVAGTIGAQTLRQFKVIFDYAHREMILEPNDHFGDPS